MTVSELIEELKEAPQDVQVYFAASALRPEECKGVRDVLWDTDNGAVVSVTLS